jgi:toxin ParE1/3/4
MRELIISPEAIQDLNDIADYFLSRNINTGELIFRESNQN